MSVLSGIIESGFFGWWTFVISAKRKSKSFLKISGISTGGVTFLFVIILVTVMTVGNIEISNLRAIGFVLIVAMIVILIIVPVKISVRVEHAIVEFVGFLLNIILTIC